MAFRSLNVIPPGGWRFYEPKIDWPKDPKELRGISLEAVVGKILTVRRANAGRFPELSLDFNTVKSEVLAFTEAAVRRMPKTESYFLPGEPVPQPVPVSFPPPRSPVAEAAGAVRKAMAGVGLLADWLGDGMQPVAQALAEKRARVCATSGPLGNQCPFNRPRIGLQKLTGQAAEDIHKLMEAKAEMKLRTTHDPGLETCQICACNLPLKVWVPMDYLRRKTPADVQERFKTDWPACWLNWPE